MAEHIERFGGRMRERREELGLTQSQLARLLSGDPDAAQVSRWERGKHDPSAERKEDIAAALTITIADLMAGPLADRKNGQGRDGQGDTADLMEALKFQPDATETSVELLVDAVGRLKAMESRLATEAARNAEMRSQIDLLVARSEPGASGEK